MDRLRDQGRQYKQNDPIRYFDYTIRLVQGEGGFWFASWKKDGSNKVTVSREPRRTRIKALTYVKLRLGRWRYDDDHFHA